MQKYCPNCGHCLSSKLTVGEISERDKERFWATVTKQESGCWISSATPGHPYSRISVNGRQVLGHILSWVLANGDVPDGRIICHKCDVPKCVNPAHLFAGTNSENLKDMVRKARNKSVRGELNGHTNLTNDDAMNIRLSLRDGTATISKLAKKYGVTFQGIWRIACGKSFAHVGGPLLARKAIRTLTVEEVRHIRKLASEGVRNRDVAALYGIHQAVASNIIHGKKRKDVPMV